MKVTIEPSIMYFGTPVIIISTLNDDGSTNIAPISSVWWLGWSCMIGLDATSKSTENLKRNGVCVLNLVSAEFADQVNKLSLLTGSKDIPIHKKLLGYCYSLNKFENSGFTPQVSQTKGLYKVKECPIQLDAKVENIGDFAKNDERMAVPAYAIELKITQVNVSKDVLMDGKNDRIDPNKWNPLIMNFRKYYGLSSEVHESRLAVKPESLYAPWKRKGIVRLLTKSLLNYSNRKHAN